MSTSAETDIKLWATLIGWFVMIFGGGAVWGGHKRQLGDHQKVIDNCHLDQLMTEDKCKTLHETRQETADVQMAGIQRTLDKVERCQEKVDARLGKLTSSLEIYMDRWDRSQKNCR